MRIGILTGSVQCSVCS